MNYHTSWTPQTDDYKLAYEFPIGTIGFLKGSHQPHLRTFDGLVDLVNPGYTYTVSLASPGPLMRAAKVGFTVTLSVNK